MERNIPHVLEVFSESPGSKRRFHREDVDKMNNKNSQVDLGQKNPGNDSAVSVDSSDEDEKNISKFFDYLNDNDAADNQMLSKKKKKKKGGGGGGGDGSGGGGNQEEGERPSRKSDYEKEMRHIERHLSMKKTIRKKMMRDLQQAFVEDPDEFHQDPNRIPPEKKNNIDIQNLTLSKGRLSKSEHNFLDMLKDENKNKENNNNNNKGRTTAEQKNQKNQKGSTNSLKDDDSGNGSPSREKPKEAKEEKKTSFWKKLTGKGKSKR
ncbi:uncharacterized protein LOC143034998 [Oratosquilla oratoria]|uniref:uncharacterized protein LOC143034998 n=1 Tax=Oratosquilla oratoria TaxID=337810 RepID=UPI003F770C41